MKLLRKWRRRKARIKIHKTATLAPNVQLLGYNTIGAYSHLNGDVVVGLGTSIGRACVLQGTVHIGRYTQLGPNIGVFSRNHSVTSLTPYVGNALFKKELKRNLTDDPVTIGHSTWIGQGSSILSGVKIGNHVVVGAGSVVTKDLPDFSIAFGNPAKVRKLKYSETLRQMITDSNWWQMDPDELSKFKNSFIGDVSGEEEILKG